MGAKAFRLNRKSGLMQHYTLIFDQLTQFPATSHGIEKIRLLH